MLARQDATQQKRVLRVYFHHSLLIPLLYALAKFTYIALPLSFCYMYITTYVYFQ